MKNKQRVKGSVLLELSVSIPVLFMLLAGTVEIGRWLNSYYLATRITYEASRYASSVYGLEEGTKSGPVKASVVDRIKTLISRYEVEGVSVSTAITLTRATKDVPSDEVTVSLVFPPPSPLFASIIAPNLKTSATATYLYHYNVSTN